MKKALLMTIAFLLLMRPDQLSAQPAELMIAAREGDLEKVTALLASGAEPDPKGIATPLFFAAQGGHIEMVRVLLANGADPNALSTWGAPLHGATRSGHIAVVEALLKQGANPNLVGGEKAETSLHTAAAKGVVEIGQLLIDHGADLNARNHRFEPPIHLAVFRKRLEFAELLRKSGASAIQVKPVSDALAGADLEAGRIRALECGNCHPMTKDAQSNKDGPTLWNIVERPIASHEFLYSEAMESEGGSWTFEKLNLYLADPAGSLPGNKMYRGYVEDREERINLIAFLRTLSDDPVALP